MYINSYKKISNIKGFSLLELLFVIMIIAVLGAATAPMLFVKVDTIKRVDVTENMKKIQQAIFGDPDNGDYGYLGDMGGLPDTLDDLNAQPADSGLYSIYNGVGIGWRGPYIEFGYNENDYLKDSWDHEFVYNNASGQISSKGPDGEDGTDDDIILPPPFADFTGDINVTVKAYDTGAGSVITVDNGDVQVDVGISSAGTSAIRAAAWDGSEKFTSSGLIQGEHSINARGKGSVCHGASVKGIAKVTGGDVTEETLFLGSFEFTEPPAGCGTPNVCASGCTYSTVKAAVDAGVNTLCISGNITETAQTVISAARTITIGSVNGRDSTIIRGGGTPSRLFKVASTGVSISIEGVTIKNTAATGVDNKGSCIYAGYSASLTITDSRIESSNAGDYSGAIWSNGAVIAENTIFSNCYNTSSSSGGGVFSANTGSLTLTNCTLKNNNTLGGGGVVYLTSGGSTTISSCSFSDNYSGATKSGGAILSTSAGDMTITSCTFTNNYTHTTGNGGAVYQNGTGAFTIRNSTFTNNRGSSGGAVFKTGASNVILYNCTFNNNDVLGTLDGGAICLNTINPISIDRCTIYGSDARYGAAIYLSGAIADCKITNSLFYNNTATRGGGVFFLGGTANKIINCTFSENSASENGSAIYNAAGIVTNIYNSIIYFGSGSANSIYDLGTLNTTDMVFQGTCSGCNSQTNVLTSDPDFVNKPNQNYHIKSTSPAKNAGNAVAGAPTSDIDGQSRPNESVWDIGADEYYPGY